MSRSNARSRGLRRRPSRVVAASIVAVILLAVGVLTAVVAIFRLVNDIWPAPVISAARSAAAVTWGAAATIIAAAVAVLAGLVLLVAGLKPGPSRAARLEPGSSNPNVVDTDFVISTRAIARLAAARADSVDGVDQVTAAASGRRVRLQVTTSSEQTGQIRGQVNQGVTDTLAAAGVQPMPRVTTAVRTKGI